MGLRRFQNFSLGALNAGRLNELIDAVARLQSQVNGMISGGEPVRYRIMARITDDGIAVGTPRSSEPGMDGPAGRECEKAIRCVSYPFEEIMLSIRDEGQIEDKTCISAIVPQDAITSERGAHLLVFEETPSLPKESIVVAHLASMAGLTATDKQQVYVASAGGGSLMRLARISSSEPNGKYMVVMDNAPSGELVEVINLYEVEQFYGALDASMECVEATPQRLPIGKVIWVQNVSSSGGPQSPYHPSAWVTMTPVPFDTECNCTDLSPLQQRGASMDEVERDIAMSQAMLGRTLVI